MTITNFSGTINWKQSIYRYLKACCCTDIRWQICYAVSDVRTVGRDILSVNQYGFFYEGGALRDIICKINIVYIDITFIRKCDGIGQCFAFNSKRFVDGFHNFKICWNNIYCNLVCRFGEGYITSFRVVHTKLEISRVCNCVYRRRVCLLAYRTRL